MRRNIIIFSILNLLGYIATVVVNILATTLPINNMTTGDLSDRYPNLFVPAGLTFSIWGLIYLLLAIFVVYQLRIVMKKDTQREEIIEKIGHFFFISSLANIGWIFAWHYLLVPISLLFMLVLLGSLIVIYLRLGIGTSTASKAERYLIHLPFSVYLGWITVATIANVTTLLVDRNWGALGLGEQFWAVLVIVVAIVITMRILLTRNDIFYALVVDWALLGILIKRLSVDDVPDSAVVAAAITGLVLISIVIIIQLKRKRIYQTGI